MHSATQPADRSLQARLAKLEGDFANSWATRTREEYEKSFRENCKQEIMNYVTKAVVAAFVFVAGTGIVFMKYESIQAFNDQRGRLTEQLNKDVKHEISRSREEALWFRYHTYGVTYRYLMESYANIPMPDKQKMKFYRKAFQKADGYYKTALDIDSQQPTTYYEEAQLNYSLAKKYNVTEWRHDKIALDDYLTAIQLYSEDDIKEGWRADAYRMVAEIYLQWAKDDPNADDKKLNLQKATKYLNSAKTDYLSAQQTWDVRKGLEAVRTLNDEISSIHI